MVARVVRSYRESLRHHLQVLFDRYELVDYAIRVGGVGSVGTRCWVALFESHDGNADNSIILQMKQAGRSVLEPYAGACRYSNQGQRVVEGKRLLQAAGDILLGWTGAGVEGVDYYVRQLWDMKGRFDTEEMDADGMALFAELCGWTLARAHARSGDPVATLGYIGSGDSFDRAITEFAAAYADQTERDHERLCRAIERGELPERPPMVSPSAGETQLRDVEVGAELQQLGTRVALGDDGDERLHAGRREPLAHQTPHDGFDPRPVD